MFVKQSTLGQAYKYESVRCHFDKRHYKCQRLADETKSRQQQLFIQIAKDKDRRFNVVYGWQDYFFPNLDRLRTRDLRTRN